MTEEICINTETTNELIESNSINIVFNTKSSDKVGTYNVSRFNTKASDKAGTYNVSRFNTKASDKAGTYNVSRFRTMLQRVGLLKPSSPNCGQPYRSKHQSLRTRNTESSSARTKSSDTGTGRSYVHL